MRNKKIFDLVIASMFMALILFLTVVPQIGYITIGPIVGITIIHIPVIVFALLYGAKRGTFMGLVFGLSSLSVAFIRPSSAFDYVFQNPLVSVLPRVIFGFCIYLIYSFIRKLAKDESLSVLLTAFLSTVLHGILVIPLMYIMYKLGWVFEQELLQSIHDVVVIIGGEDNFFKFIFAILGTNTVIEALLASFIVPPVYKALRTLSESRK